jgi:hypothetical protein
LTATLGSDNIPSTFCAKSSNGLQNKIWRRA